MKTARELLNQYAGKPCITEAWLEARIKEGKVREIATDVFALFDFDNKGNEFLTHVVWFGDNENRAKEAIKLYPTR